jgi:integrase
VDKRGRPVREHTDRYGSGLRYVAQWTEHGRRRTKSFRTKDGAEAHLADIARAVRDGTHVETAKVTVAEFARHWMDAQLHQKQGTHTAMDSRWRNAIEPMIGHLQLNAVTKRHIEGAASRWAADHAPAYTKGIFIYANAIFAAAVKDRLIAVNPCDGVKLPKIDRGKIEPMTTAQVWEVAGRVHPRYQCLILLAAATGMRSGELRGLTVDRIKYGDPATIRVDRQLTSTGPTWGTPKSDSSARVVAVDPFTVDALAWHMTRVPTHPSGLIFTGDTGGPLNPATISGQLRHIGKAMHLPSRFGLHAFRHYHASLLIAAGLSVKAVAARLGHKDSSETLRTYAHLWADDEERSVAAIKAGLWG